jgi:nucleotide-binding universal stress UspA family protein
LLESTSALVAAGVPAGQITAEVVFGEVSNAILNSALQHRADMIVMGSHAGPVRRLLLGSAASAVLRGAEIPVLVAQEPEPIDRQPFETTEASTPELVAASGT